MDYKIAEKYRKVKALFDGATTEGERDAARAALARLEEKYPELTSPPAYSGPTHVSFVTTFTAGDTSNTIWINYA